MEIKTLQGSYVGLRSIKDEIGGIAIVDVGYLHGMIDRETNEVIMTFSNEPTIVDDFVIYYGDSIIKTVDEDGKVGKKTEKRFTIYDIEKKEFVVKDWMPAEQQNMGNYYDGRKYIVLQNPKDGKFHVFDTRNYRTEENSFEKSFDSAELVRQASYGPGYLALKSGDKYALFSTNKGLESEAVYDKIESQVRLLVLNEGGKYTIKSVGKDASIKTTHKTYDNILLKGSQVFCVSGKTTEIYMSEDYNWKLVASVPCDSLEQMYQLDDARGHHYIYQVRNGDKITLVKATAGFHNKTAPISLESLSFNEQGEPQVYDKIEHIGVINGLVDFYSLENDGKFGLFGIRSNSRSDLPNIKDFKLLDGMHDKIMRLGICSMHHVVCDGDKCDVVDFISGEKVLADVRVVGKIGDSTIIYEKDGKFGIGISASKGFVTDFGYDEIKYIDRGIFEVTKEGKKGLNYYTKPLVEPNYASIEFVRARYGEHILSNRLGERDVILKLKKLDNTYEAGILNEKNEYKSVTTKPYTELEVLNTIIVGKIGESVDILSYCGVGYATFPANVIIEQELNGCYYRIDGQWYFADSGSRFRKAEGRTYFEPHMHVRDDNPNGIVVINELEKAAFEEAVAELESVSPETMSAVLEELNEKSGAKERHPQLTMGVHPAMKNEE